MTGLEQIAGGQEGTQAEARVRQMAAEGVVEFVHGEDHAHAQVLDLVEAAANIVAAALRLIQELAAVQHLRQLDAEHHCHLVLGDDLARLGRRFHDAEPAAPRTAVLRVDVVLQLVGTLRLQPHILHDVAVVALERIDLTEDLVMCDVVDENLLAREEGALDPAVIGLVVHQGVVARPLVVAGPADRLVRAEGVVGGHHLQDAERAFRAVVDGAIAHGVIDAEGVEIAAVVDATADELVGSDVGVVIDPAVDGVGIALPVRARPARVDEARVQPGLGILGAAVGRLEGEQRL